MFNNFGVYNYLNFNKNLNIDKLLSDNDTPPILEDLLIEEGIIDELQNKNEKLIKYLNKEKIKQMLDYIIKEPKDEEDHNKGYKFPFICSKLFNVEDTKIMKYFFKTNKELNDEKEETKKQDKSDLYFNIYQNDDNNDENNAGNIKDKEINIDFINNNEYEDNNEDNCNYKDVNIDNGYEKLNNDEVNIEENKNNSNNKDDNEDEIVIQDKEEKKDNIIKDEEKIDNNKNNEKEIINQKDKDKDKNICLFKSPDSDTDNQPKNIRYEMQKEKKGSSKENSNEKNKDKENKEEENKYPEDKIELLDYFFSFLNDNSELNYVLCGYFSSLMLNLLNMNSIKIIKYLFLKRKDILKRFVYHSYRKSIAEILCKIIKYEDKFIPEYLDNENNNDYDEKEFSLIRLEIINDIFEKIDINMNSENLFSLSFIINDLTENKKIFESIVNNKNIIQFLISKQLKNINLLNTDNESEKVSSKLFNKKCNFTIIIDMIISWLNNIVKYDMQIPMLLYEVNDELEEEGDFVQQKENDNVVPEVHHTFISQTLFDIIPELIKNNFNKLQNVNNCNEINSDLILQSFNDVKLAPLGSYKIKIVEMLTSLLSYCKNIPNEYDNLLINSNYFENAINYIFQYEWNNLYQEAIFEFFDKLLEYDKDYPYHELSTDYLFSKLNFLSKIIEKLTEIKNNKDNDGNTGNGYTAFLIGLSYKINVLIGGNYVDLKKSYTKEGIMTFKEKGESPNSKLINMVFNMDNLTNLKDEKNNKDKNEEIKPIDFMKKYCNEEWNNYFKDNISNKIKVYEGKLCQQKNRFMSFDDSKDDLFENENNNDNNEEEDLLGRYKSRDEELFEDNNHNDENEDLVNNDINDDYGINKNNKDMSKYKDMEINLNDFDFIDDKDNKKDDDNENKDDNNNKDNNIDLDNKENENKIEIDEKYNTVNYWKKSIEKENNSYLNNLGEEALNELLE